MSNKTRIIYAQDDTESVSLLLRLRLPSLLVGLLLGVGIALLTSRFEEVLARNVQVAFFLPFIVYMADAIGTQTESIYSRDLKSGRAQFYKYLVKESMLGAIIGAFAAVVAGFVAFLWLKNNLLALSVGLSMFITVSTAPVVALLTTAGIQFIHEDPAAGAGPIATVIQDALCVLIYGIVCTTILLS